VKKSHTKTLLTLPLVLLALFFLSSCGEKIDDADLVERDGIYYKKSSDIPFSGEIKSRTHSGWIKDGKRDGPWVFYYDNGQLASEGDYKNGKEEGPWVIYFENGLLSGEGDYKSGFREGPWVEYWENGQLRGKGNYKGGCEEGPWVKYNEDGILWESVNTDCEGSTEIPETELNLMDGVPEQLVFSKELGGGSKSKLWIISGDEEQNLARLYVNLPSGDEECEEGNIDCISFEFPGFIQDSGTVKIMDTELGCFFEILNDVGKVHIDKLDGACGLGSGNRHVLDLIEGVYFLESTVPSTENPQTMIIEFR
jgi:hypothetical protein